MCVSLCCLEKWGNIYITSDIHPATTAITHVVAGSIARTGVSTEIARFLQRPHLAGD